MLWWIWGDLQKGHATFIKPIYGKIHVFTALTQTFWVHLFIHVRVHAYMYACKSVQNN